MFERSDTMTLGNLTAMQAHGRAGMRGLAVVAAVAADLAVWLLARGVVGVDLDVHLGAGPPTQVGPVAVAATTMVAGLAAWALLAALERRVRRPRLLWTSIALAVLAVSLVGPLGAAATASAMAVLAGMHLVAGLVLIPTIALTSGGARRVTGA
jgi:Family of unknown function (DUF6069)